MTGKVRNIQSCISLQNGKNFFNETEKLVESWNQWAMIICLSDHDKCVNGHCKFFVEYEKRGRLQLTEGERIYGSQRPRYIATARAEPAIDKAPRKIRHLTPDHIARYSCVVAYWGQVSMPVRRSRLFKDVEQLVPSISSMGLQRNDLIEECITNKMCKSVLYGFVKLICFFRGGKLNRLLLGFGDEWINNLPVPVIQSGPNVEANITDNDRESIYDGFVFFSERGALARLRICFKDVSERALVAQKFVDLRDVLRRIV